MVPHSSAVLQRNKQEPRSPELKTVHLVSIMEAIFTILDRRLLPQIFIVAHQVNEMARRA